MKGNEGIAQKSSQAAGMLKVMKRIVQAIICGVLVVVSLFVVLVSCYPFVRGNTDNTLAENFPPAWILYWTDLFVRDNNIALLVGNILVYSLMAYVFLSWRAKQKHLP